MQIDGEAHRIERETFYRIARQSTTLYDMVANWHHVSLMQASFTALSHVSFTVPARLARYILMVHDRVDGDELPLRHDQLAGVLAA
jgi:hypothetical protein